MREVLVLNNYQNDYFKKGNNLVTLSGKSLQKFFNSTIANILKYPVVVHVAECHPKEHFFMEKSIQKPYFKTIAKRYRWRIKPVHCVMGTKGAGLVSKLKNFSFKFSDTFFTGTNTNLDDYSAFSDKTNTRDTGLQAYLQATDISNVILAGGIFETFICRTALQAIEKGYKVFILEDSVVGYNIKAMLKVKAFLIKRGVTFI